MVKHSADLMVLASIIVPPLILTLDFKVHFIFRIIIESATKLAKRDRFQSKEELKKAPQTLAEYEESVDPHSDTSDSSSESSFSGKQFAKKINVTRFS